MAIAHDADSASGQQSSGTTYSWNHTCTGANLILTVDVELIGLSGDSVSSVTYNGVNLTFVGATQNGAGTVRVESWQLLNPATGLNQITVNFAGSIAAGNSFGNAVSYTGAGGVEAYNGAANDLVTSISVNVTTVADNDWVHAACASSVNSITAGQTSRNNTGSVPGSGANEDTNAAVHPAGVQAMSYSSLGAGSYAIGGFGIKVFVPPPVLNDQEHRACQQAMLAM